MRNFSFSGNIARATPDAPLLNPLRCRPEEQPLTVRFRKFLIAHSPGFTVPDRTTRR
jgi:hypothetical protein